MVLNGSDVCVVDFLTGLRLGACFGFCWSSSGRIWDLRRAEAAARRAGHHGLISFLIRRLLRRFSARGEKWSASTKNTWHLSKTKNYQKTKSELKQFKTQLKN